VITAAARRISCRIGVPNEEFSRPFVEKSFERKVSCVLSRRARPRIRTGTKGQFYWGFERFRESPLMLALDESPWRSVQSKQRCEKMFVDCVANVLKHLR
jgi:hypothetical protein